MRNWSFKGKVHLASLALVIAVFAIAATSITGIIRFSKSQDSLHKSYDDSIVSKQLEISILKMKQIESDAIFEPLMEQMTQYPKKVSDSYKELDNTIKLLESKITKPEPLKQLDEIKKLLSKRKEISDKVIVLSANDDVEGASNLIYSGNENTRSLEEKISKSVINLVELQQADTLMLQRETQRQEKNWLYWMGFVSIVSVIFGTMLTQTLFKSTGRGLKRVSDNLTESAGEFLEASRRCSETTILLAQTAAAQTDVLEKAAVSIKSLVSVSGISADEISKINNRASEYSNQSLNCQSSTAHAINFLKEINTSNSHFLDQVELRNKRVDEIISVISSLNEKTKLINEIAFKTKLLSFNASVEAARAGENGKGFSIVAEEISNISQLSAKAEKEIGILLTDGLQRVESEINEIRSQLAGLIASGREKFQEGTNTLKQTSDAFQNLTDGAAHLATLTKEVCSKIKDQSEALAEINTAMSELASITQQDAVRLEECAVAAHALADKTETIHAVVRQLSSFVTGHRAQLKRTRLQRDDENLEKGNGFDFESSPDSAQKQDSRIAQFKTESKMVRSKTPLERSANEETLKRAAGAEDVALDRQYLSREK